MNRELINSNGSSQRTMTWEELKDFIRGHKEKAKQEGEPIFMGIPDRWYETPTWRCTNGHVSSSFLKTDEGDRCLACQEYVRMTYPEDKE